jgi:hypothetical protein
MLNDQSWTQTAKSHNHTVSFSTDAEVNTYMMFTMTRCATVFAEEILQQRLQRLAQHYAIPGPQPLEPIIDACAPTSVLLCFMYRKNWWAWACSKLIAAKNMLPNHRALHYNSPVDFTQLNSKTISNSDFDFLTGIVDQTFNLWCNIRLKYPQHQARLYTFEDAVPNNQHRTNHSAIPYKHKDFITNYHDYKQTFMDVYLPHWQMLESNALMHLANMQVQTTNTI